jgi:MAP/microtubule affinity-regulating kinase
VLPPKPPLPSDKKSSTGQLNLTTDSSKIIDEFQTTDYILGKQIGKGSYAIVRQAVHRDTKEQVAVKVYDKYRLVDRTKKLGVRREIQIMEKLNHCYVVKLYESLESAKQIQIVMEQVKGLSLLNYLRKQPGRRLGEDEGRRVFRQVLQGMEYCHSQDVVHRDLKLENLLLDESDNVRIIDFGFATCYPDKKVKLFCGTPSYMAPEIVGRKEYRGQPADVWALGVLLFAMLTGSFPFKGLTDADLYKKIQRGVYSVPADVPLPAKYIIEQMLRLDPAQRPSISEVLKDEWFITPETLEEGRPAVQPETFVSCKNPFIKEQRDPLIIQSLVRPTKIKLGYSQEKLAAQLGDSQTFASILYNKLRVNPATSVKHSRESTAYRDRED